jgi:phage terminase large subunit
MALLTSFSSAEVGPTRAPVDLTPRTEAQRAVLRAREREVCFTARKGVGKTWTDWVAVLDYVCTYPGSRGLVCREERASMENTTLPVLWEIVPRDWRACWRDGRSTLSLPNGSEVHVDGLDRPSRMQGSRYGIAACDQAEDLDFAQFQILNGCVGQHQTSFGERLPYRKLILAFNPSHTDHWAYRRYQPDLGDGLRADEKGRMTRRVVHAQPGDLDELMPEDYRHALSCMTGVFYKRMVLGLWCSAEGQVFDAWDPALHVASVEQVSARYPGSEWERWGGYPPPDWERYFGIDFGYAPDPFACGWWAFAPDGTRYLYRQLCHTRRTIEQQAEQITALEAEELAALREHCPPERAQELRPYLEQLNIAARYSDHHRGERAMLAARGIHTMPADKDVLASIQTCLALMKVPSAEDAQASGRYWPTLQVLKGSLAQVDPELREAGKPTCLEEETTGYIWRSTREGSMGGISRQLPRQVNDHCIDGILRYVHHSLASRSPVGVWT